jgi:predicted RNase H-like HicB family nuclease
MVTVDRDEDGIWIVECPSIPGCVSQGETKEVARGTLRSLFRSSGITEAELIKVLEK